MKKREIFLDFTSLLDVTLIVIFFFVIFSTLDGKQNKERTDQVVQEYKEAIAAANDREKEADDLAVQLQDEIDLVKEASERQGNNISEIIDFKNNSNLKLILRMNGNGWTVSIIHGDELISALNGSDNIGQDIIEAMKKAGYTSEQTILCDFVYDGSVGGTRRAYKDISNGLDEVKLEFQYFYVSETDYSIGGNFDNEK